MKKGDLIHTRMCMAMQLPPLRTTVEAVIADAGPQYPAGLYVVVPEGVQTVLFADAEGHVYQFPTSDGYLRRAK